MALIASTIQNFYSGKSDQNGHIRANIYDWPQMSVSNFQLKRVTKFEQLKRQLAQYQINIELIDINKGVCNISFTPDSPYCYLLRDAWWDEGLYLTARPKTGAIPFLNWWEGKDIIPLKDTRQYGDDPLRFNMIFNCSLGYGESMLELAELIMSTPKERVGNSLVLKCPPVKGDDKRKAILIGKNGENVKRLEKYLVSLFGYEVPVRII